jgi:hypothetical protein
MTLNQRLLDINNFIDNNINDNIKDIILEYNEYLKDYVYVKSLDEFIILPLKGPLKYINKYDGKLRSGGLLIKIYLKNKKWIALIKQFSGKTYNISFDSNYIFYIKNKKDLLKDWLTCFIAECDSKDYII